MVHFCATKAPCSAMNAASDSGVAIRGFRRPAARSANLGNLDQSRISEGPFTAVCRFNDFHHRVIFARSKPRGEAKKRGRNLRGDARAVSDAPRWLLAPRAPRLHADSTRPYGGGNAVMAAGTPQAIEHWRRTRGLMITSLV